jgi:dTDP-4-amino-4,6-dideoxygalactose transaminase
LPKLVVPVHFTGRSCDMAEIAALGREYGFRIVEDAAHAIGAVYHSKPVGACEHSDIAVFSLHPVKIITTGEGGLATTNDPVLAQKMATLRTHGVTREANVLSETPPGDWYYEQHELGFNYRMTDMQAALGSSQLTRLHNYIQRRREIAVRYDKMLSELPLMRPPVDHNDLSAWHLYVIRLTDGAPDRAHVFAELRKRGIGVQVHYIPVHMQPYYRSQGFGSGDMPVSEDYYERAISLPMFPTLTEADQDVVVQTLRDVLAA